MNIRRFTGASNHEVMRQVRMALGPDALIVSSRRVDGGIEILAADADAMDDEGNLTSARVSIAGDGPVQPPPVQAALASSAYEPAAIPAAAGGIRMAADGWPARPQAAEPPRAGQIQAPEVMDAITALRGALEQRMDGIGWERNLHRAPASASLFRTLMAAGFSTPLLRAMLARLPESLDREQAMAWARNELVTHLPVMAHEDDLLGQGGVFALVGPTGVGKTTTIAKLAARCVLRVGANRVAMLTTDSYRIGAHEQLQIYGRLMGVPVHGARDAGELRQVLAQLGDRSIVLIDNVGISQRDRYVAEQAAMLCTAGRPVRRLLVLNAASHGDTLDEVAHAYRNSGGQSVEGCIITKLDEAPHLGTALDTAIRHRLPIHYVSHGQKVPEHLSLARAPDLVDRALARAGEGGALYAPSEADLTALWSARGEAGGATLAQADPARRRQLLLSAIARPEGGGTAAGAPFELDAATEWIQHDAACSLARGLWEGLRGGDETAEAQLARVAEAVREAFARQCRTHLLAMHGKAALKGEGPSIGSLAATLLMSDRGDAIAAPAQQLVSSQGTIAAWGGAEPGRCNAVDALVARAAWLSREFPQLPVVHVLDAGTARLWQQLSDRGAAWLSRIAGGLRVVQEDGPTTAQALARSLMHAPVQGAAARRLQTGEGAGGALSLWAAEAEVALTLRNPAPLRLVSARLVDAASGEVAVQLFGLSNIPAAEASASLLAGWLAQQEQARGGFRQMAHAWHAVEAQDGIEGLRRQLLAAGQIGLASWQVSRAASAGSVRRLLNGLAGPDRRAPARALPGALVRLFALLEMAGETP